MCEHAKECVNSIHTLVHTNECCGMCGCCCINRYLSVAELILEVVACRFLTHGICSVLISRDARILLVHSPREIMAIQSECILVSVRCTYHMNKSLFDQQVVLGGMQKPLTVSIYICLLLT